MGIRPTKIGIYYTHLCLQNLQGSRFLPPKRAHRHIARIMRRDIHPSMRYLRAGDSRLRSLASASAIDAKVPVPEVFGENTRY